MAEKRRDRAGHVEGERMDQADDDDRQQADDEDIVGRRNARAASPRPRRLRGDDSEDPQADRSVAPPGSGTRR